MREHEPAPEREVLGRPGSRTAVLAAEQVVLAASGFQNGHFWQRAGPRTGGSGASGRQNGRFWGGQALERAVLQRVGSRTGGSGGGTVPDQGKFWCERALERAVLARASGRTGGSGAAELYKERFWRRDKSRPG